MPDSTPSGASDDYEPCDTTIATGHMCEDHADDDEWAPIPASPTGGEM